MGLYNNVPTFTYVSATGITVTYNKQVYTVQSFYTNKKYIYWDYDNATVLQASNTMPTRSFKTHLVIINDNGIATAVPSTYEGFEISYTGDSDDAIKSRIYALHQKDKELGDKYVAIEQDVDGIKQIVGSSETNDNGTIMDRLSVIEQTAKDISLKVEENQTAYNSDKEATKLREDLNSAIINLNADLSTFNGEMIAYYKDDKISNEEKVSVETMLELITYSRSEVLVYADKVKLVAQANENTSGVTSLNSAIQSLDTVHTSLINIVTTAIGDGIITPTEKTVITNAVAQYNLKINEFKNTCDDIIFLGFGGTVVEKLAQISMNSNEIKLSVSTVESNFTSELSLQKEELKGQIDEVSSSLGTFKETVETTFRDGLITEAEKKVLLEKIEQLEKEKLDVDARYTDAYNSKYLISPHKENLKNQHDKFDSKHLELKSKISEVVALGNVTENETLQINTLFNEYSVILSELKVVLDNSLDIISTGKANEEILKAKEELSKEIGDINSTLEDVVDNLDYLVSDGIVDASERKAIEATLTSLEKEKTDVEAQFTYWGSNSYLVDPLKSQYDKVYETYLAKYDSLVNVIENIIYKEGLVNDTDRNNMTKADTALTNALYDFLDKTNEVIEFVTLKQYEDLISVVEEDIKDIYGNLKELDIVLDGTLEDSFLNEAEKIAIREQLAILDREKAEVDVNHENVYNNPYLSTELKTDLKSEYDSYVSSYNYLVSTIEEIVNTDGLIPTASQIEYSNAVNEYKENIGIYTIILKECVDDIANNSIDEAKEILHNEISDVIGSLEKLETDMNEVFRDGVLSDAEKTTIKQQLETLKKEKEDVDKQYSALYSNASLVDTTSAKPKSELKTAYDNFVTKYNSLVSTINTIIAKTTIVDNTDRTNLSNALNNYRTASSTYITKATNAIDAIASKKAETESGKVDKKYADIILGEDGIQSIVEHIKDDYASKSLLEQTANGIQSTVESIKGDYVGQSQLTQTVDSFTYKFNSINARNLVPNGNPKKNNYSGWWTQGDICGFYLYATNDWLGIWSKNTSHETFAWSPQIQLFEKGDFSVSFFIQKEPNVKSCQVFLIGSRENNYNYDWVCTCTEAISDNNFRKVNLNIHIPTDINYVRFRIDHDGNPNGIEGAYVVWFGEFMLIKGKDIFPNKWYPALNEVHNNITTIDKDGIKVNSPNSNVNTIMNSNGFYVQQNGSNILQADGNGINLNQGQVALNQRGLWVNSPNSSTNTAIDSNGFYVNQNGHQILKVDGGGLSLNQGQVSLNQWGLWVNSPNTDTSTNIDANGFYIRQGNTYPLRADGDGVTIGQGRVLVNKWGVQVYHDDGSYSQMDGAGFLNYNAGTGHRYHHLITMGEYECYSEETKTIWLPAEFRGKPFRVITAIKRVKADYDLYVHKAPLLSFYAQCSSYNHAEGWISVYASVRGWNYNNNMGSDRGQIIGDEGADNYILKPIVAYWVIA